MPFHCYNSGGGRCARPNSGAGHRVSGPKTSTEFLPYMLPNAESNAELEV